MDGEVRVFLAGGNTIAWCLKVPSAENFLANTRAGSRLSEYTPSPREVQIAQKVGDSLLKEGVYFAGLDLIAGWLSEVNITCPALLRPDRESLEGFDLMARQIMGIT